MKQRIGSNIMIRDWRGSYKTIAPITRTSIRKFMLMSEDYIRLDFSAWTAYSIDPGDYIEDAIFGKFVVTKKQAAKLNPTTGAYDYSIQFDAEYMALKNKLLMLVADDTRKEASWSLTQNLEKQLEAVSANIEALGYDYGFIIEKSAENAKKVYCMNYTGVDIITALNNIAETWQTEWWFENNDRCFHFGKCEYGAEIEDNYIMMRPGENVESMDIQDDSSDKYANKLYVYGSKDNLPSTYRKNLILQVTQQENTENVEIFKLDRNITNDMLSLTSNTFVNIPTNATTGDDPQLQNNQKTISWKSDNFSVQQSDTYRLNFGANSFNGAEIHVRNYRGIRKVKTMLSIVLHDETNNSMVYSRNLNTEQEIKPDDLTMDTLEIITDDMRIAIESTNVQLDATHQYSVRVSWDVALFGDRTYDASIYSYPGLSSVLNMRFDVSDYEQTLANIVFTSGNVEHTEYYVHFNPFDQSPGEEYYYYMSLYYRDEEDYIQVTNPISIFGIGTRFTLKESNSIKIPSAWYSSDYDNPAALARLADGRLMLPMSQAPEGFIGLDDERAIERAIVFDDIYPDGKLVISHITETKKKDIERQEGEAETTDWQWTEYALTLTLANGDTFDFKNEYRLPDQPLYLRFITPNDMHWVGSAYINQCKLSGMKFEVAYNRANNTFTLLRNEDWGAKLPSELLNPTVGDPCVLIGWNVKSMNNLGLIDEAEQRLYAKGMEYLNALNEGSFTFTMNMMSRYAFERYAELLQKYGDNVEEYAPNNIYASDGGNKYAILKEGQRVIIGYEPTASEGEYKSSRIIGYELKLDKPYDSAQYIVGETQAYSRLAKIEKEITNLN